MTVLGRERNSTWKCTTFSDKLPPLGPDRAEVARLSLDTAARKFMFNSYEVTATVKSLITEIVAIKVLPLTSATCNLQFSELSPEGETD